MPFPQYQINLGYDPLLAGAASPVDYITQTVDIEPLLGKMTDNLIVAATKEYPDLFGGVTIGNGKIKIGIPGIDKDIVLEAADIDHFKSCLK